ncbi:MAG: hypothetical protein ACE5FC_08890, partial [Myxococcota bacterium]
MNPFLVALCVALLNGAALGVLDLARVAGKFGWYGGGADLAAILCFSAGLGVLGALLLLLPAVALRRWGPGACRRAAPWPFFHGFWFGANAGLLFLWKRYTGVFEAGGEYGFPIPDLLAAILVGLLAGAVFGPTLDRLWRVAGGALRWPVRLLGARRAGVAAVL